MRRSSPQLHALAAAGVLVLLAVLSPLVNEHEPGLTCPPGFVSGAEQEAHDPEAVGQGVDVCLPRKHPESIADLTRLNTEALTRSLAPFTELKPGAYSAALAQRDAMVAGNVQAQVPGSAGTWTPLGKTPLLSNQPGYNQVNSQGFVDLAGRVQGFAVIPGTNRVYAGVAEGGVWRSDDLGGNWVPVGDSLPTQIIGAVGWTPAGGAQGTLLALTGDGAFGRYSVSGLGMYRTVDDGKTWLRSEGIPDGALGFTVAVDPTNASVIYAATSAGLYRSADAGRTFVDVLLPTGACAGRSFTQKYCFLANEVTDVVVQGPDKFGHKGGRVLAVVGWREGNRLYADPNPNGARHSTANGWYRSETGVKGSFTPMTNYPLTLPQDHIGRTEMGVAEGPDQNHDYVYAVVGDAIKMQNGFPIIDVPEGLQGKNVKTGDVLNGIYVSPDFGTTWNLMALAEELKLPTTGSALDGPTGVSLYAPGVQSWYNEWAKPDPTRQTVDGVPTHLTFGLEEVWENLLQAQPLDGHALFHVIGRYYGGTTCLRLDVALPVCPTNIPDLTATTTTHPDQHGAAYIPDGKGGVTLLVGNDGGVYRQTAAAGAALSNGKWGDGHNKGFQTLQPYHATMAKDGTVWAGLQDNGEMKITPDGRQIATFGGDGFFSAVDPNNSKVAYEEYTGGQMSVTTDGGKTWTSMDPALTAAGFITPFKMDPRDPKHLIVAGRDVKETLAGPNTPATGATGSSQWVKVYDLGTRAKPGDAAATAGGNVADNHQTAIDLEGSGAYVGYCGFCDTLSEGIPFANGIATNVGGKEAPKPGTGQGWHIAKAKGLPTRFITSIAIDPKDHRTVYVTLAGFERRWAPPGALGEDIARVGTGHVFKSTDAAETFTDISGNLPDIPSNWVEIHKDQLVLGTDLGAFLASDTKGTTWAPLTGLPNVQVRSIENSPRDPNELVAATFGRGVYIYHLVDPAPPPKPALPQPQKLPELQPTGGNKK